MTSKLRYIARSVANENLDTVAFGYPRERWEERAEAFGYPQLAP